MLEVPNQGDDNLMAEYDEFDDLDRLRGRSAERSARFDGLEPYDYEEGESGFLSRFTPVQRLILALFLLVDVIIIGYVLLVLTGRLPSPF